MTTGYRTVCTLLALAMLSGCASSTDKELPQLKNQVSKLNQQLQYLNDQASALLLQNTLNEQSTTGVYLYPAAQTAARVDSDAGKLQVSLGRVEPEANGARALLHIRTADATALQPLNAVVDWGQIDPTSGKPLTVDTLSQPISVPASLLGRSEATVELRLSGLTPEQVGYIRLHDITRQSPVNPPAPDATKPRDQQ